MGWQFGSANGFTVYANSIHENIKTELRWSTTQIEFLDTLIKMENGQLYPDVFIKPTDKQL